MYPLTDLEWGVQRPGVIWIPISKHKFSLNLRRLITRIACPHRASEL